MFSHRPIFLHQVNLPANAQAFTLQMAEDFAVVSGLSANSYAASPICYPICEESQSDYLIPGGVAGLPYVADLGRPGGLVAVTFLSAVTAIVVATYSAMRPKVQPQPFSLLAGVSLSGEPDAQGNYNSANFYLSDVGTGYDISFSPMSADAFYAVFRSNDRWKGVNGYPGFTFKQR